MSIKDIRLFLLDMDGTIYRESELIDGATSFFALLREQGKEYAFMTNNSSKNKVAYIKKLRSLGIETEERNIVSSITVTLSYLKANYPSGAKIYLVGTKSFKAELEDSGFAVVPAGYRGEDVACVLLGFDTELDYSKIVGCCYYVSRGYDYIATNCDLRCPVKENKFIPDCGAIANLIEAATERRPKFLGKPQSDIVFAAAKIFNVDLSQIMCVGDRLYTDIAVGINAGVQTALVFTGESKPEDLKTSEFVPTYSFDSIKQIYEALEEGQAMYYKSVNTPSIVEIGRDIIGRIDGILMRSHLVFPRKILITNQSLFAMYEGSLSENRFDEIVFCNGGDISEAAEIKRKIKNTDSLVLAFGGGSILDIVKYCASECAIPYISLPSTLSNDAIYSCVARLTDENKKKRSFGVMPPIGIIVDLDVIRNSPNELILAGIGDLISNLSAVQDWRLAHEETGEPVNELAFMLAKEAAIPLLEYSKEDLLDDVCLSDLANGLITSGLSMIISRDTRGTSGAEHMISHAIDEYFTEKAVTHGIQVAWAFIEIERQLRGNVEFLEKLSAFYDRIGLSEIIQQKVPWTSSDLMRLIPYAMKVRNRYTIFNSTRAMGLSQSHSKPPLWSGGDRP